MYRYFQGYDDSKVYWRVNTETDVIQHVVSDWSNLWADPLRSVIHGMDQIQIALDRGEIVEIDYNPIATDATELKEYDC